MARKMCKGTAMILGTAFQVMGGQMSNELVTVSMMCKRVNDLRARIFAEDLTPEVNKKMFADRKAMGVYLKEEAARLQRDK